jgi:hypothetical protein
MRRLRRRGRVKTSASRPLGTSSSRCSRRLRVRNPGRFTSRCRASRATRCPSRTDASADACVASQDHPALANSDRARRAPRTTTRYFAEMQGGWNETGGLDGLSVRHENLRNEWSPTSPHRPEVLLTSSRQQRPWALPLGVAPRWCGLAVGVRRATWQMSGATPTAAAVRSGI